MLELVVRLVASLALVVGMLWLMARFGAKRFRGAAGSMVQVVHRQPLSRTSALVVVTVGPRVLVLGTTEQSVTLVSELDPDELTELGHDDDRALATVSALEPDHDRLLGGPQLPPRRARAASSAMGVEDRRAEEVRTPRRAGGAHRGSHRAAAGTGANGALAGSVLSAQTWRQALAAVSRRAS